MENNEKPVYYDPRFIEVLRRNMQMSPETWRKIIAADPTGWREMLEE